MAALAFPLWPQAQKPDATAEQHFIRAGKFLQAGDLKEAATQYQAGLALAPQASEAHNNLGAVYLKLGNYDLALQQFQIAVSEKPGDADYLFNRGFALFHLDHCADALPDFVLAAKLPAYQTNANYLAGLCAYHLERWRDAVAYLQSAAQHGAPSPEILYMLIRSAKKANEPDLAMKNFAELASRYPDSLFVHELLAEAYDLTHDASAAEREFLRAAELSPNEPDLNFDLGYLYWKDRRFEEAGARFKREIAVNPGSAGSFFYLGDIALKQSHPEKALSLFRRALELDPNYPDAWSGIGKAYEELNQSKAAEDCFQKAIAYNPNSAEPHYRLAQLLNKTGRTGEAKEQFKIVKQLQDEQRARVAELLSQSEPHNSAVGHP